MYNIVCNRFSDCGHKGSNYFLTCLRLEPIYFVFTYGVDRSLSLLGLQAVIAAMTGGGVHAKILADEGLAALRGL